MFQLRLKTNSNSRGSVCVSGRFCFTLETKTRLFFIRLRSCVKGDRCMQREAQVRCFSELIFDKFIAAVVSLAVQYEFLRTKLRQLH